MNPTQKGAPRLSEESWRPGFYGLVREGRKLRVSGRAVRLSFFAAGLLVLALQIEGVLRPSFRRAEEAAFPAPAARGETGPVYAPPVMDAARQAAGEREAEARRAPSRPRAAPPPAERIRSVSLMGTRSVPNGAEVVAELRSGGANGMLKAATSEPLKFQGEILLPENTVLIGKGKSDDERLYVAFRRAVLPDRTEIKVRAQGYDGKDKILGLRGKKISDYPFRLAMSSGLVFLGGMADGMREDNAAGPWERRRPTARDAALNGVTTATADLSRETMESMKKQEARVEVAQSTRILIIFGDVDESDKSP